MISKEIFLFCIGLSIFTTSIFAFTEGWILGNKRGREKAIRDIYWDNIEESEINQK